MITVSLKKAQAVFNCDEFKNKVIEIEKMIESTEFQRLVEMAKKSRISSLKDLSHAYEFLVATIAAYPIICCGQRSGVAATMTIKEWRDAEENPSDPTVIFVKKHKTSGHFLAVIVIENPLVLKCYRIYAQYFRPIVCFGLENVESTPFLLNQSGNSLKMQIPFKFKQFQNSFETFYPQRINASELRIAIENVAKHLPSGDRHSVNTLLCHSTAVAEHFYVQNEREYAIKGFRLIHSNPRYKFVQLADHDEDADDEQEEQREGAEEEDEVDDHQTSAKG